MAADRFRKLAKIISYTKIDHSRILIGKLGHLESAGFAVAWS